MIPHFSCCSKPIILKKPPSKPTFIELFYDYFIKPADAIPNPLQSEIKLNKISKALSSITIPPPTKNNLNNLPNLTNSGQNNNLGKVPLEQSNMSQLYTTEQCFPGYNISNFQ